MPGQGKDCNLNSYMLHKQTLCFGENSFYFIRITMRCQLGRNYTPNSCTYYMEPVQQRGLTHNMHSMYCMEIVPHDT